MTLHDTRLLVCAEFVKGNYVCDVGTDHGCLPAFLLLSGKCGRAIAADINEKPLSSARTLFEKEGLTDKTSCIISDGLSDIPLDGVTDIVIAGMGGELIFKIISSDTRTRNTDLNFILQPMTRTDFLRKSLWENGFDILREKGAVCGRFAYTVINCVYTGKSRSPSPEETIMGMLDMSRFEDRTYVLMHLSRMRKAAEGMGEKFPRKAEDILLAADKTETIIRRYLK